MDFQRRDRIRRNMAIATVIAFVGGMGVIEHVKGESSTQVKTTPIATTASPNTASSSTAPASSSADSASGFKDGTYSAQSDYSVPHGYESIKVSLTVKNGTVTDSQIVNSENDPKSAEFQQYFAQEYQSGVIGQSLSSLNLSNVSGASDTTAGFNDAVNSIRSQAQS